MFKNKIGQIVYYLKDNKIHSAPVLSRMIVENDSDFMVHTDEQKKFFNRFGKNREKYATCHGEFFENQLFISKEEVVNSLIDEGFKELEKRMPIKETLKKIR